MEIQANINGDMEFRETRISLAGGALRVESEGKETLRIDAKSIKSAAIEEGVGIGRLVITTDSGEIEASYFTKDRVRSFRKFADAINLYVKDGKEVDADFSEKKKAHGDISTVYWLMGFASKHKRLLIAGLIASLAMVGLNLVPPYMLKILIDSVILSKAHNEALFVELTVILVASYASSTLVGTVQNYTLNITGNRIVTDLRGRLFDHAVRLPANAIDNVSVSRIQTRLISDTGNTQWLMTYGFSTLITNALTILGIGVILFAMFPSLALYVLLPIPVILVIIALYNGGADRMYHRAWRRSADLITRINDAIPNYTIVKSASKEGYESGRFKDQLSEFYNSQVDITKMELKYWQPVGFLMALSTVVIWWIGGNLVIAGTLQLGVITAFLAYMGMFYGPIQQISTIMPYIQESVTSGQRLREVFDSKEFSGGVKGGSRRPEMSGDIVIKDLWFGYDPLFPVLKGANARIKGGRSTSIIGKSGAGKSTMAKLLMGLYAADSGKLLFGNTDISGTDIDYLRDRIAYVPQDSSFFDNTVLYNMTYFAKNEAGILDVVAAAKAVEMHDEIMKLPLCYDNRIRGRGMSLSGGQRQRLAVARAMLKKPDIVLLDEITSNLDAVNSRKVNRAVLRLEAGKTLVFITHDLSEIMSSDNVVVIDGGIVSEQGSPAALARRKGALRKMFGSKLTGSVRRRRVRGASLDSFLKGFIVPASSVSVSAGARRSMLDVSRNGRAIKSLVPRLAFPVSRPEFVIMYNRKGREVFAIEDYTKLPGNGADVLRAALKANSLNPTVKSIRGIRLTGDGIIWSLGTDRGDLEFTTRNRNDIITGRGGIVLIDEFNTPLKISRAELDQRSAKLLDMAI